MTKEQAITELGYLSHGTLAVLTREERQVKQLEATYTNIDELLSQKLQVLDQIDVSECVSWNQVWSMIERYQWQEGFSQ